MAQLVSYSDSDDSDSMSIKDARATKRRRLSVKKDQAAELPVLPDTFHNLYTSNARLGTQDDPSLHGGRQRQTPHVEGSWPTHIYIDWFPNKEQSARLQKILVSAGRTNSTASTSPEGSIRSLLKSELGADLPLHISLSRPIALLTDQRQSFLDALTRRIRALSIASFQVRTGGLDWVANEDQSRHFLVLRVQSDGQDSLSELLKCSNQSAADFRQPMLYPTAESAGHDCVSRDSVRRMKDSKPHGGDRRTGGLIKPTEPTPSESASSTSGFHISIGWSLEELSSKSSVDLETIPHDYFRVDVPVVKAKIGNAVHVINLVGQTGIEGGIM